MATISAYKKNCPWCGSNDYETVYYSTTNDVVVGCSDCIRTQDGWEYTEQEEERSIDEYIDACIDAALGK